MAARKILQLDEDSRTQLQRIVKRSGDWREQARAGADPVAARFGAVRPSCCRSAGFERTHRAHHPHTLATKRF